MFNKFNISDDELLKLIQASNDWGCGIYKDIRLFDILNTFEYIKIHPSWNKLFIKISTHVDDSNYWATRFQRKLLNLDSELQKESIGNIKMLLLKLKEVFFDDENSDVQKNKDQIVYPYSISFNDLSEYMFKEDLARAGLTEEEFYISSFGEHYDKNPE